MGSKSDWALYRGEELLYVGTKEEIMEMTGWPRTKFNARGSSRWREKADKPGSGLEAVYRLK